ncbi:hypothetical protein [Streptomyces sp. ADI98-10]|uniref:hypothetical protein n=1 Tax=Streptomyces sp. ADI98-10 TaxID=1522763 RepID=UPI000F5524F4|nr:hypothetical protein [Streptomyces sp. ADI98-10]RPK88906.1 hypothetical protein EES46_16235 [Streptomyces sp. ADI98-10]
MRWDNLVENGSTTGNSALFAAGAVTTRTFDTPEFRGITFHEIRARSILNRVPGASRMPFEWTVNPYRGCTHLRPGAREWYLHWLGRHHPRLVPRYERMYADGAYAPTWYQRRITRQVHQLADEFGIGPALRGGARRAGAGPHPADPAVRP